MPQLPVDLRAIDADFYAWTGHKAYGPTGIGVLHGRRSLLEEMPPFIGGGHMIRTVAANESTWTDLPWKFEAGTSQIAEAIGRGAAVDWIGAIGIERIRSHEEALVADALERLSSEVDRRPGERAAGIEARVMVIDDELSRENILDHYKHPHNWSPPPAELDHYDRVRVPWRDFNRSGGRRRGCSVIHGLGSVPVCGEWGIHFAQAASYPRRQGRSAVWSAGARPRRRRCSGWGRSRGWGLATSWR
ncbi:MAG: aminotransferase class V-fold PLP-dependent enzyme [Solirubrobacteraceae bacterium]